MLLKGLGCIVILSASSMFGFCISHDYLIRLKNLEQIKKMLILLKGEIKYNNSGINESMSKISAQTNDVMGTFLEYVWQRFDKGNCSLREAWNEGIESVLKSQTRLVKEDIIIIEELGVNLGITDKETQINNILNTIDIIEMKITELNETRGEKCRLYKTLGVMAGVFMAIVLI